MPKRYRFDSCTRYYYERESFEQVGNWIFDNSDNSCYLCNLFIGEDFGPITQLVRVADMNEGSWRNRLAQESYTFKVDGSSPSLPTKHS